MPATSRCPAAFQANAGQGRNSMIGKDSSQRQQTKNGHVPGLPIKFDILL
jgi:hypothetical protein